MKPTTTEPAAGTDLGLTQNERRLMDLLHRRSGEWIRPTDLMRAMNRDRWIVMKAADGLISKLCFSDSTHRLEKRHFPGENASRFRLVPRIAPAA